jgi:transposase
MKKYVLFIGIDISKKWIDVSLSLDGQKSEMIHQVFDNQVKGFSKMLKWISSYAKGLQIEAQHWVFCMEHTGLYHLLLCCFLAEQELDYIQQSALAIHLSLGLKRGKNDKADSMDIARYAYLHRKELSVSNLPDHAIMKMKNLLAFRARLIKYKNGLQVAAKEMDDFMAQAITSDVVSDTNELTNLLKDKIRKTEQQLKSIVAENEALQKGYDLATSVKGIGLVSAMYLIVYTNGFKAFPDARKFACFIGVAPFAKQSGSTLNQAAKVSNLGHRKLKSILSNAAMVAIKHDQQIKAYYLRKIDEGKNKFSVFNAVKNKLIARVFATVKRGTPYVELNAYA